MSFSRILLSPPFSEMKVRSWHYPTAEKYEETIQYNEQEEYLDVAYQSLKKFNQSLHAELSIIKKLYIDHNHLTSLPSPSQVPCLEELNCSDNCLTSLPNYPHLTFLDASKNALKKIPHYQKLEYMDVSYNKGIDINLVWSCCQHLYITHCELSSFDFKFFPVIKFVDLENNLLESINESHTVEELNIPANRLKKLPPYPFLRRLYAEYNKIDEIREYPELLELNIQHNLVTIIRDQNKLKDLNAEYNKISQVGKFPKLRNLNVSYNLLQHITLPPLVKSASLHFNPMKKLSLQPPLIHLKELQLNFETYKSIYYKFHHLFQFTQIKVNPDKLKFYLNHLSNLLNRKVRDYILKNFQKVHLDKRNLIIYKIALYIYLDFFQYKKSGEFLMSEEFRALLDSIKKLYLKTIIFTIHF